MKYQDYSDQHLIALIAESNTEALETLYDRYSGLVFSVALHVTRDHPTAEEITLDVFTRVWQKPGLYRVERGKVSTWLASISRYQAIDVLRKWRVRPEQHSIGWGEVAPNSLPKTDNPADLVELSLQREQILKAVAQLPPEQQEALALAFFKGYTHSQIAEKLNQPLGTVKTRIRLAVQKLRALLPADETPVNPKKPAQRIEFQMKKPKKGF